MMTPTRWRSLAVAALAALAIAAGSAAAPAQQTPRVPNAPPGGGAPTAPSAGPPTPIAGPTIPGPLASGTPLPGTTSAPPIGAPSEMPGGSASPATGGAGMPPSPPAGGTVVQFTGELLDLRNGYVYFTTADAFKAATPVRLVDFDTGGPTKLEPGPKIYARATLDPATGAITELALTKRHLPTDAAYQAAYAKAHGFAVAGSPTVAAPELQHGVRLTGRAVAVTFFVQVPPTTPLTDDVYITTDASGWIPNAMKMDRVDALHYRLTRTYASGTKFAYRYTRGAWTSVEVGEDGLQGDPHQFLVPEVDAKRLDNVVYRWSDQNGNQPEVGPDSIPTPFNPNPFGNLPSTVRSGIPSPSPTPRP